MKVEEQDNSEPDQENTDNQDKTTPPEKPETQNYSLLPPRVQSSESDVDGSDVHVVARVRPLNQQEVERNDGSSTRFPSDGAILVENQTAAKTFSFHGIFQPGCTQKQVFEHSGMRRLLSMALDGYACTAFAFGQTGSGKTYTMTGPVTPEAADSMTQEKSLKDLGCYGLIQYSFAFLMEKVLEGNDVNYTVKASYLEIYNEQVQDLLNPLAYESVQVRWSKGQGFHVENLFVREIESLDDLMSVLEDGMRNRAVAEHNMNEHSSRSHSILTVYLDSESATEEGMSVTKHGKVSFVDLAGSEKVKDTGSTGETLIEATNINRSLLTLGNCISALSDPKKRTGHIPFRDSKLTKLLADGLGGSGVTLMIACVTPSSYNVSETLNTLRYAKRARKIKNKPVIRIDPREELILKLQREMKLLKQENLFLRDQLEFPHREKPKFPKPNTVDTNESRANKMLPALPAIKSTSDGSKASSFESPDHRPVSDNSLYGMLQEYMVENEALRNENHNLLTQHSVDEREHRIISRDNDKLARKLEDLSRLMLSSPMYGSSFVSRTNSGHSLQSLRTFSSSLTPLSQKSFPYNTNPHNVMNNNTYHYHNDHRPPNQQEPFVAWNQSPQPAQHVPKIMANEHLPPLRGSPHTNRQFGPPGNKGFIKKPSHLNSKWMKATSYASQFKRKQTMNRPLPQNTWSQKKDSDVMKDFPMRDYQTKPRPEFVYGNHGYDTGSTDDGHSSALRNPNQKLPANFHVRFNKPNFLVPNNNNISHKGGALPNEAYKAQDISPRSSMTKELSATSLRRLNHQMRQEMEALDHEIDSYQRSMQRQPTKNKLPVT
nr:kinesin-like protein KIF12 [Ciona intestinalis]|eukprot:XP_018667191.1 kinesin-like protein KIF12 [Ciona intestinalis]